MAKTISFHNGTTWSRGHNVRDERYTSQQEHIDSTLTEQNVNIRDVPVRQAYADIFGQAVNEYNAKQKRSDRRITDYYDKIKQDKRKHPVYECIVQIGDRSDTGNAAELEKQALIRFAEEWDKRNPNLRLIGAYIHCDEPDGTVHMHLDYIPVAECTRGMRLQNSLDRALQQQGFKSEDIHRTAQIAWQDREREVLCDICIELGIDAQRNQGIGQGREYLTPQEYKRAKQQQQEQIDEELQPIKEELDEYRQLQVSAKPLEIDEKKSLLGKRVSIPAEDYEKLKKQARAYRVNRKELKDIRGERTKLEKDKSHWRAISRDLEQRSAELSEREKSVNAMYDRQKDLNQLLEQSERDGKAKDQEIATLKAENGSLRAEIKRVRETLTQKINDLSERFRGAYTSLANVVKAVGMLKYDKIDGYKVEGLTKKQDRLIDGLAEYGAKWAKEDGFPEMAEEMEKRVGISKSISKIIEPQAPKRSKGHEMEL